MGDFYDGPKTSDFKVWHIPQVPMDGFFVECESLREALKIMDLLAEYDLFQFNNNIKPDYSNASGIVQWNPRDNCYDELDEDEVREQVGA